MKEATHLEAFMIKQEYDNIQAVDLPPPTEGVALNLRELVYKEYYVQRMNSYYTMYPEVLYPIKEDK